MAQRRASLWGLRRAAAPGRMHPAGPRRQLQPPSQAPSALSATARLPPRAAGLRGHGALQHLPVPFSEDAARARGLAPTPARWGRGGQSPSERGAAPQGQL